MSERSAAEGDSEIVEQLKRGMRRRRAQLAGAPDGATSVGLEELERNQLLEEPPVVSAKPIVGGLIVLTRKVLRRFFIRWYADPLLRQQNSFNANVSMSFRDLLERQRRLQQEIDLLQGQVESLERGRE